MSSLKYGALSASLGFLAGVAAAQTPRPLGDEFAVSSFTSQQSRADVAVDAAGEFVVVWQGNAAGEIGSESDVVVRRFAADGSSLGEEFLANTTTTSFQRSPAVARNATGEFVIAWNSGQQGQQGNPAGGDGDGTAIRGRRFNSTGTALGDDFQVNAGTEFDQFAPDVAIDDQGRFVVVWTSGRVGVGGDPNQPSQPITVRARRYDSDGSPLSGDLDMGPNDESFAARVAVDVGPSGDFIVLWDNFVSLGDDSNLSVQAQRLSSAGMLLGDAFQVNTYTTYLQYNPAGAIDDSTGAFVVVWASGTFYADGPDGSERSVQVQRFSFDGAFLGNELQVNTHTTGRQGSPAVTGDVHGHFVVVWDSGNLDSTSTQDGSGLGVFGRALNAESVPEGGEFQVSVTTLGDQRSPAVSMDPQGRSFVVAWESVGQIRARRFAGPFLFEDGFESGDLLAWSTVVGAASQEAEAP